MSEATTLPETARSDEPAARHIAAILGELRPDLPAEIAVAIARSAIALSDTAAHASVPRGSPPLAAWFAEAMAFGASHYMREAAARPVRPKEIAVELDRRAKRSAREDWAGPVASAGELAKRFGLSKSTLHDWRKGGTVIGLKKGPRNFVYPLAQFVDGRPVEGIAAVVKWAEATTDAWAWMVTKNVRLDGEKPIDALRTGKVDAVVDAAKEQYSWG